MHSTNLTLLLLASSLFCGPSAAAQGLADLSFTPALSQAAVGDTVEIVLVASAQDDTPTEIGALDAILIYDPSVLQLLGNDQTGAGYNWFVAGFLTEPDGINLDIGDGEAKFTALAQISVPATAPLPPGLHVTTLRFLTLSESAGSVVSLAPTLGSFARTQVIDFFMAGLDITGDISSTATISVSNGPVNYCGGTVAACPCGNDGGPGEGCLTSTGAGATISASGSTSLSADDLVVTVSGVPHFQHGVQYMGQSQIQLPFGDGLRCVGSGGSGLVRFPVTNSGAGGVIALGPGFLATTSISSGSTWNFQGWFRDPLGPCGSAFNLSSAISISFQP